MRPELGQLLGLLLWAVTGVPAVATLMPLGVGGLVVGGMLGGIYRVKENQAWAKLLQIPDLEASIPVEVIVRPADEDERVLVVDTLDERAQIVAS